MHRILPVIAVAAATLGTTTIAAPQPAHAEVRTVTDAAGDATRYVYDVRSGDSSSTAVPRESRTDVVRVRFAFGQHRLVVVARVRQLGERTRVGVGVGAGGEYYEVSTGREGRVRVFHDRSDRVCSDGASEVDRQARTYRFEVPLSCIGDPTEARFGLAAVRSVGRDDGRVEVRFDDVRRTGARRLPQRIALGPVMTRG